MSWLEKLIAQISFKPDARMESLTASMASDETSEIYRQGQNRSEDCYNETLPLTETREMARSLLNRLCIVSDIESMFALAVNSVGDAGCVDRMILRKQGDLLEAGILRAHSIRTNTKVGALFWNCLTEKGRAEPVQSADVISGVINKLAHTLRNVSIIQDVMGNDCQVEKIESNMLAGPCCAVKALPLRQLSKSASLFPLVNCNHPDQCACRYKSVLPF